MKIFLYGNGVMPVDCSNAAEIYGLTKEGEAPMGHFIHIVQVFVPIEPGDERHGRSSCFGAAGGDGWHTRTEPVKASRVGIRKLPGKDVAKHALEMISKHLRIKPRCGLQSS
ncbi:hypothetical protein W7K_07900 [Stenotrophomonas geniculata N1]|uniref:Uncharacterized protein n=1 Tax=Stenotrophomonas geniculata N1 TaxID=1167641 RepID=A0A0L8ABJ2_9GAMM|nr:hypothetical protein W7K_07900 [Stenotrophomonas geniculata N1]